MKLYHSSSIKNLDSISPSPSTHGTYVYATPYLAITASYLAPKDDFDLWVGLFNGTPCLIERYTDALMLYKEKNGSIYELDSSGFEADKTPWKGVEWVSSIKSNVINETKIECAYKFLLELKERKELLIYRYPNRPDFLDPNDSDLKERINKLKESPNWPDHEKRLKRIHSELFRES
jgi:hypothetical protein